MINKEEIRKNIQRLLRGYADASNDIKVTVRTAKEVDVYIDGELFNTYLIEEKKFKNNIIKSQRLDDAFKITVIISRDDLAEKMSQYEGAELQLPATENEVKDAFERARINNESQRYTLKDCKLYDSDEPIDIECTDDFLKKFNFLAKVMSGFSNYDHRLFRGYRMKYSISLLKINELINAAYNLNACEIIDGITDAEALGRMYADNGMLEWLSNVGLEVWKFLDYSAIGENIRETGSGIFTEDGYFTCREDEVSKVYDGITFPEQFEEDRYIFKLYIGTKTASEDKKEKWLSLPVSKEGKASFLKELGEETFDNCVLMAVQSMESDIPMCIKDLSQLGLLNSLAHRMRDMEKAGELPKFKAALAGFGCGSLETAIEYANRMQDFVLYSEASSEVEYAKQHCRQEFGNIVPDKFFKYFNFAAYSVELAAGENIVVTEYGVIKDNGKEKIIPQEEKS